MVVGILRLTLSIPGARSLKDKRRVVHKLIERAKSRYNAAIAEVGENDIWQRAQLGAAVVANDRRFVDEMLAKLTRDIEHNADASLLAREVEIETYSQMHAAPPDKPDLDPTAEELAEDSGWDLDAEEKLLQAQDAAEASRARAGSAGSGSSGPSPGAASGPSFGSSAGVSPGGGAQASVGGGDAGGVDESGGEFGEPSASGPGAGSWLTESDFEGEAK